MQSSLLLPKHSLVCPEVHSPDVGSSLGWDRAVCREKKLPIPVKLAEIKGFYSV